MLPANTVAPEGLSVLTGGPLYRLYRRAHLAGPALQLPRRRAVIVALVTWVPLLALTLIEGDAWGRPRVPFLLDVGLHVRFLVVTPILIGMERLVHCRMRSAVDEFLERGLVSADAPEFKMAVASAAHLRDSPLIEAALLAFVYCVGIAVVWPHVAALNLDTWYWQRSAAGRQLTMAGWWYTLVSLPIFQFLLYRWYVRLLIWTRFLWQTAHAGLRLIPTHPDLCGGLGFMEEFIRCLAPLLFAHGALFAGVAASGILFEGRTIIDYWPGVLVLAAILIVVAAAPLLAFVAPLWRARRIGLDEYGRVAQRYVLDFDRKWVHREGRPDEPLLGNPDIQSLADLSNSFQVIARMRAIPLSRELILGLAISTLLPAVPLLFTVISIRELAKLLLKRLFRA
jgi:hypothetical protein